MKTDLPNCDAFEVKGKWYARFRKKVKGKTYRVPIKGEFNARRTPHGLVIDPSPEFTRHYEEIKESFEGGKVDGVVHGSVDWLILAYKQTPEWDALAASTRRDYDHLLKIISTKVGKKLWVVFQRPDIIRMRNAWKKQPRKADKLVTMMQNLGETAIDEGLRKDNPAHGVSKINKSTPHRAWEPDELWWFEGCCDHEKMRMAYLLGLYTGQREGDVLKMTRQMVKDGLIQVVQEKTETPVWIPIHPSLQEEVNTFLVGRDNSIYIIARDDGQPFTKDGFRAIWNRELKKAGVAVPPTKKKTIKPGVNCTFHGLRKNACRALAEAGCSEDEIKAITGHKTTQAVQIYTREARQKLLAQAAMRKLTNAKGA